MSNTQEQRPLGTIFLRFSVSLFLFSLTFCGALLLSQHVLIPRLATAEVEGERRNLSGLRQYQQSLAAQLNALESRRETLLLPPEQELYASLKERRESRPDLLRLAQQVQAAGREFAEDRDVVVFSSFAYRSQDAALIAQGDIRNVGPRSMTVLAQFVEQLKQLPFVTSVESSRFTREIHPELGTHSPFSITLFLQ